MFLCIVKKIIVSSFVYCLELRCLTYLKFIHFVKYTKILCFTGALNSTGGLLYLHQFNRITSAFVLLDKLLQIHNSVFISQYFEDKASEGLTLSNVYSGHITLPFGRINQSLQVNFFSGASTFKNYLISPFVCYYYNDCFFFNFRIRNILVKNKIVVIQ